MHLFSSKLKGKYAIIDNTIAFTLLNPIPSEITKRLEDGNRDVTLNKSVDHYTQHC